MKSYWPRILLWLFLVTLGMIIMQRYVGEAILIKLMYILWTAKLIIQGLPQLIPWLLFLIIAFFMAVRTIGLLKTKGKAKQSELPDGTGQVSFWAKRINKTAPGGYYQRDNARLLGRLTIGTLNLQGRKNHKKPAAQLVTEASDIPDDIKAYFLAGFEFETARIPKFGRLRRFLRRLGYKKTDPLDLDPERVVEYLETISE